MSHNTLFLHMGPGLNAHVEREVLAREYPLVHFWDQPPQHNAAGAFSNLVQATVDQVETMFAAQGEPIWLFAHSFGGHIATAVLRKIPEKIRACRFVSTGYDLPGSFFNLLRVMATAPDTAPDLKQEITAFLVGKEPRADQIWDYLPLVIKDPTFNRHYWPQRAMFEKYIATATSAPGLDFQSFQNIVADFLAHHFTSQPKPVAKSPPISIALGALDPLLVIDHEVALWSKVFPRAKTHVEKESGHFIHLEPFFK